METELKNQGIMPTVTPSWPEFTSSAANGVYMLTMNYAVSGTLNLNANVTIIFAGGIFTGTGTINGNNTTFVAPPIQVFDANISFSGTWKMEKVFAENFGDTNGANAAPAINKALAFSNISGCIVQLLGKTYNVTGSINILGGTTLQGTIAGPSLTSDSSVSKEGTVIYTASDINVLSIITTGNESTSDVDCYRFAIKDLTIRHAGSGTTETIGNSIFIDAPNTLPPRKGLISNIILKHNTTNGYGIRVSGGSYIEFHNIHVRGGKGVKVTGNKLQEFLWFNKVEIDSVNKTSFEITHGNNIYLTEIDTNDSKIGLMINNETGETFNVFVNRFNSARCTYGILIRTVTNYITRIKISEATIIQQIVPCKPTPVAGLCLERGSGSTYTIGSCIFENFSIDAVSLSNTAYRAIKDTNLNSVTGSKFTNIRTYDKIDLQTNASPNNQLTIINMQKGGVYKYGPTGNTYTQVLYSANSPLPGKPVVLVNTNQTIPFSVVTTNEPGGVCDFTVTFASAPTSNIEIYFTLTGFFYT